MIDLKKIGYIPTITIKKSNSDREVKVLVRRIGMSIFKAQRVIDQIRERSYEETLMILEFMPYQAAYPILKLVYSAARKANHNMGWNEVDLFIFKAEANRSIIRKRFRPQARGRSYVIKRSMCHITIVLKEKKSKSSLDLSQI